LLFILIVLRLYFNRRYCYRTGLKVLHRQGSIVPIQFITTKYSDFSGVKDKQTIRNHRWSCIKIQLHCIKREHLKYSGLQI